MQNLKNTAYRWLRSSESLFKTDMVYLAKGGFWLTASEITAMVASLGTSVAFANLIEPETYGAYRYVLSLLNILSIPTLLGINTALLKSVAQGYDASIIPAFKARLSWGVFGAAAGMGISTYYLWQGNLDLAFSLLVISIVVPLFYGFEVYNSFLNGKKLFKESSFFKIISSAIPALSLISTLFLTDYVPYLLLSYFAPYTAIRAVFLIITIKKYSGNTLQDEQMLTYGKRLSLLNVLDGVAENLDKLIMWHLLGPQQLALYSFALLPVNQIAALKGNLKTLVFPKIAVSDIPHLKKVVYGKTLRLFFLMSLVVLIYILSAPFIFSILFPQYLEAVNYSRVFALTVLFFPIIVFVKTVFTAHARIKEQFYINTASSLTKILLMIILIPFYGIWGGILALLATSFISAIVQLVLFKKLV